MIYTAGITDAQSHDESESDSDEAGVGAQAPPLTKHIRNILNRYPEGGQILKVYGTYKVLKLQQ